MTRQQQNAIILGSLSKELKDKPNVQESIGQTFTVWFAGLAEQGLQLMAPPSPVSAAAAEQAPPAAQPQAS